MIDQDKNLEICGEFTDAEIVAEVKRTKVEDSGEKDEDERAAIQFNNGCH